MSNEHEALTTAIITWFENRTGFHVQDHRSEDDATTLSASYGGNWISFDAAKLAEYVAAHGIATPSPAPSEQREAMRRELVLLIERMCPDKPDSNFGHPIGTQCESLADAILSLSLPAREVGEVVQRAVEHGQACLSTISRDTSHVQIERAALRTLLRFATEALATTPAPREMGLVEASSLRSTVRDIAESEAIPTAAEAYEWCRDLARAALAKLDRSAEEG